jgi:hypothetical protein
LIWVVHTSVVSTGANALRLISVLLSVCQKPDSLAGVGACLGLVGFHGGELLLMLWLLPAAGALSLMGWFDCVDGWNGQPHRVAPTLNVGRTLH